jgi:undecaprenyl-diphosphatase
VIEPLTPLYGWYGLNERLFMLINGVHAPGLDHLMLLVTWLGHPRLFPFYIALALLAMWRRPELMPQRNVVVFGVSYALISLLLVPALKAWLDFPRPLAVLGEEAVVVLGTPLTVHSFPSGHSAYAVLVAASLAPGLPRGWKWTLAAFAVLVCVSRISVGAHYPADVLGGAALSLAVVAGIRFLSRRREE